MAIANAIGTWSRPTPRKSRNANESAAREFLTTLAKASGIGTPTRADLARITAQTQYSNR